jgi:hypothetical protein
MKRLVVFSFCLFFICSAFAQNADTTRPEKSRYQTILQKNKNGRSQLSGFFTTVNELSLPSSNRIGLVYSIGGEACALFNQRFYVGGYGLVSLAPSDLENSFQDNTDIRMLQVGGTAGFKIAPNKPIHLNIGTRVGYASLMWFQWDNYNIYNNYRLSNRLDGWSVTPHANIEVNFFSWMQAYAGVGYRMAWGGKDDKYDLAKDLRQPTFQIGVSFGYFK